MCHFCDSPIIGKNAQPPEDSQVIMTESTSAKIWYKLNDSTNIFKENRSIVRRLELTDRKISTFWASIWSVFWYSNSLTRIIFARIQLWFKDWLYHSIILQSLNSIEKGTQLFEPLLIFDQNNFWRKMIVVSPSAVTPLRHSGLSPGRSNCYIGKSIWNKISKPHSKYE